MGEDDDDYDFPIPITRNDAKPSPKNPNSRRNGRRKVARGDSLDQLPPQLKEYREKRLKEQQEQK